MVKRLFIATLVAISPLYALAQAPFMRWRRG